jgi:hypothetical protein
MRRIAIAIAIGIVVVVALSVSATAHAQSWKPPAESQRCPSKWGAGDERGSANHMKPEAVLKATRLIKSGEVIDLAHVLSAAGPLVGTRRFDVHPREHEARRAVREEGVRVRVHDAASEDAGLLGLDGRADRRPLTRTEVFR